MACMEGKIDGKGFVDITDSQGQWRCVATCVPCKRDHNILRVCKGWLFEQYDDVSMRGGFYGKQNKKVQCPSCRQDYGGRLHAPEWVIYSSLAQLSEERPWLWPIAGTLPAPPGTIGTTVTPGKTTTPAIIGLSAPAAASIQLTPPIGASDRASRSPGMQAALAAMSSSSGDGASWAAPGGTPPLPLRAKAPPTIFSDQTIRTQASGSSARGPSAHAEPQPDLKTILRDMQELRREVNELRAKVQRLEQGWTWA